MKHLFSYSFISIFLLYSCNFSVEKYKEEEALVSNETEVLNKFINDYPENVNTPNIKAKLIEIEANNALNSNEIKIMRDFMNKYPTSFENTAKIRQKLEPLEYKNAITTNDTALLKQFILYYPNHPEIELFKKKLIVLEVDAIFNNSNTGRLPGSDSKGTTSSGISTLEISNNTSCDLQVRYSGPEVKMIELPANGRGTVTLTNGIYKIAATACGSNYAGKEDVQSDASSQYYISTY